MELNHMNTLITSNTYRDRLGNDWLVNANENKPIIKQHMDKIIDIALQAKQLFKRPIAYHFWIRLNQDYSIIKFVELLKKHYLRRVNLKIEYVRVEEYDEIKYNHHHFFLFVDRTVAHPQSLSYFLNSHTRKRTAYI